ncbi:retbindin [Microcaecilia unicolor]|uniref:Retbindin n=1 Tax=Microcaecilia unicolor TaxID=1415580 RepID=A0A6P7XIS3_9AMPH|nr:retbindin [Microcaecilia unicolor]
MVMAAQSGAEAGGQRSQLPVSRSPAMGAVFAPAAMNTLSLALASACILVSLYRINGDLAGRCLSGGKHKTSPSPEIQLWECQLYADNACCSEDVAEDLSSSPMSRVNDILWNRCGSFSPKCEEYLKRIECFYRCSPTAALWSHPEHPTAIQGVPLCLRFCHQWYDVCKDDLTCARNWLTDWQWGPDGNNCTRDCITYGQMYKDGQELCENIWGDSFVAMPDPCQCLTLTASDLELPGPHSEEGDSSETAASTKLVAKPGRPCPVKRYSLFQKLKAFIHKRSVFMEDVEGSGSGF